MADNLKPKAVGAESADSLNPRNEEVPMADNKPQMKAVPESAPAPETTPETPALEPEVGANPATAPQASPEQLDEDEKEFRSMRRDLPGVAGASAVGIVSIGVAKVPGKNEFFRTHPDFRRSSPSSISMSTWTNISSP
jgi:hypothetical protein